VSVQLSKIPIMMLQQIALVNKPGHRLFDSIDSGSIKNEQPRQTSGVNDMMSSTTTIVLGGFFPIGTTSLIWKVSLEMGKASSFVAFGFCLISC